MQLLLMIAWIAASPPTSLRFLQAISAHSAQHMRCSVYARAGAVPERRGSCDSDISIRNKQKLNQTKHHLIVHYMLQDVRTKRIIEQHSAYRLKCHNLRFVVKVVQLIRQRDYNAEKLFLYLIEKRS
jgi:hypothetical protein